MHHGEKHQHWQRLDGTTYKLNRPRVKFSENLNVSWFEIPPLKSCFPYIALNCPGWQGRDAQWLYMADGPLYCTVMCSLHCVLYHCRVFPGIQAKCLNVYLWNKTWFYNGKAKNKQKLAWSFLICEGPRMPNFELWIDILPKKFKCSFGPIWSWIEKKY